MSNQTWESINLPPRSKPIVCKWVFKRKYHTNAMIQTFKAILIVKGFKQREGVDGLDTYVSVTRITLIKIFFALASIHNSFVHQMDVKTTFLNGVLNEVYMERSKGFVLKGNENKVWKLVKSLYGLKQAPKHIKILIMLFFQMDLDITMRTNAYILRLCDYSVLYVDYMLFLSDNMKGIMETKRFLSSSFKIKDLGEVDTKHLQKARGQKPTLGPT